jgi:hypothetical protein
MGRGLRITSHAVGYQGADQIMLPALGRLINGKGYYMRRYHHGKNPTSVKSGPDWDGILAAKEKLAGPQG